MNMYIVFLLSFAVVIIADLYDIRATLAGIAKGVGVESNSIVTTLAGTDKPSFMQLLTINMLIPILPIAVPGLFLAFGPAGPLFFIPLLMIALNHYLAARQWNFLIAGGNPNLPKTWWQKLFNI